jgi:hypothetical protein
MYENVSKIDFYVKDYFYGKNLLLSTPFAWEHLILLEIKIRSPYSCFARRNVSSNQTTTERVPEGPSPDKKLIEPPCPARGVAPPNMEIGSLNGEPYFRTNSRTSLLPVETLSS